MQHSIPILCGSIARTPNYLGAAIHSAGYAALGLPYTFAAFGTEDTAGAVAAMRSLGIRGLGVGVPHKQAIIPLLDEVDPIAQEIGAVNVVVNNEGRLTGYNVDWIGALRAVEEVTDLNQKRVVLVGAGGAARAVAYGLKKGGAHVTLFNRNEEKGKVVADELNVEYGGGLRELSEVRDYDIVAHATSAGFHESTECAIDPANIIPGKIVFEVVHMPKETPLTRIANEKGARVIYGYKMLLHLAGHIFELFTQQKPPLAAMEAALMKEIGIDA